jgi:predicted ATPase
VSAPLGNRAFDVLQVLLTAGGNPVTKDEILRRVRPATLGVEELAARLDDLFRLLTGGRRTALPRHRRLRATLDWSYELLPSAERTVLRRVAVLPGPFELAALSAVAADGEITVSEVIDSISNLVLKSLIAATLSGALVRYRLLDTTRAPIFARFDEGFASADLMTAQALLNELQ